MGTVTSRAVNELRLVEEALAQARAAVRTAAGTPWVSAAADGYRRTLGETDRDLARLEVALGHAWGSVLRHVTAVDGGATW